jgi:TldD protein
MVSEPGENRNAVNSTGASIMRELLEDILDRARDGGADFADIRVGDATGTSIVVQDGRADRVQTGLGSGAGLRVLVDGAWGMATTPDIVADELRQCLDDAVAMAKTAAPSVTDPGLVADVEPVEDSIQVDCEIDPRDIPLKERVTNIFELEKLARENDDRIVNTVTSYADAAGSSIIANTAGTYIETEAVRCRSSM